VKGWVNGTRKSLDIVEYYTPVERFLRAAIVLPVVFVAGVSTRSDTRRSSIRLVYVLDALSYMHAALSGGDPA